MVVYQPSELDAIEFELRNNKAVIVDTDTVMGVVSLNKKIIYKVKHRPRYKKLVIFINEESLSDIFNENQIKVLKKYWPGKLTVIKDKVGYRIPNDKFLISLLKRTNFLYSSSANLSGNNPIKNLDQANKEFKKYPFDVVFVENKHNHDPNDKPSTIIDLDDNVVLREGNINGKEILKELNS